MLHFRLRVEGLPEFRRGTYALRQLMRGALREIEEKGRSRRPLSRALAQEIVNAFSRRSDPQTGRRWAPLARGGAARLIRTGALFRQVRTARPWVLKSSSRMEFDLPRSVWYGERHQTGDPSRNLPRRGFLPSERTVNRHLTRILGAEAQRRWKG